MYGIICGNVISPFFLALHVFCNKLIESECVLYVLSVEVIYVLKRINLLMVKDTNGRRKRKGKIQME